MTPPLIEKLQLTISELNRLKSGETLSIHGSLVSRYGGGILFMGVSGSGKSTAIASEVAKGAILVADDRTLITIDKGSLTGASHPAISGLLHIRNQGIIRMPYLAKPCRITSIIWL